MPKFELDSLLECCFLDSKEMFYPIPALVLLSRPRGLQGRDGKAGVGSDAQTLLEGTTAFFQTGRLQRSLWQYPGWELSSEPLSAAGNQLQTRSGWDGRLGTDNE